jgi:GNAT superfamily N-acetyltransferase
VSKPGAPRIEASENDVRIAIEAGANPDLVTILGAGLTEHSLPFVKRRGFEPIAAVAHDSDGRLVGGIHGLVNWTWLHVALVWVDEQQRHRGLGSRLLAAFEAAGIERGCKSAHLDTFSYQARPFYERHGYTVFATLDDYPPGEQRFFMRKALVE